MSTSEGADPAPGPGGGPGPLGGLPDAGTAAEIRAVGTAMLRGGLVPAVVVGVVAVVVAALAAGGAAVGAALLGVVLVLVVCSLGPLVMRWTARSAPLVVMGVAMVSFVAKLGLLAVILLVLKGLDLVDTRVLALAVGACALAFIAGETVAFARARPPALQV